MSNIGLEPRLNKKNKGNKRIRTFKTLPQNSIEILYNNIFQLYYG